jgi:hypothetical protein
VKRIVHTEKHGLTLGQLRDFLKDCEGLPDDTALGARVTWGRKLMEVSAEAERA